VLAETSVTSYAHAPVAGGTTYYYRVSALNAAGESQLSSEIAHSTPISLWTADGTAADAFGTNPGALMNGADFAAGEIGSAFQLAGDEYISI